MSTKGSECFTIIEEFNVRLRAVVAVLAGNRLRRCFPPLIRSLPLASHGWRFSLGGATLLVEAFPERFLEVVFECGVFGSTLQAPSEIRLGLGELRLSQQA